RMFAEINTNKRNVLHDDLLLKETPCQHTAHRVVGTISLNASMLLRIDNSLPSSAISTRLLVLPLRSWSG
ncbi:hypothetical protein, partial [Xenorhabdus littoralis]|uniref:hypothetical protein n=1 Tax=Xenorhabdus littoralis TaxID=2582835 RepID=UPI0029E7F7FD